MFSVCLLSVRSVKIAYVTALGKGEEKTFVLPQPPQKQIPSSTPNECVCPDEEDEELPPPPPKPATETELAEQIINFENEIQNIVYVK